MSPSDLVALMTRTTDNSSSGEGLTCHQSNGPEMMSMAGSVLKCGMSNTDISLLQRSEASSGDEKRSIEDAPHTSRENVMRLPPFSGRRAASSLGAPACNGCISTFKHFGLIIRVMHTGVFCMVQPNFHSSQLDEENGKCNATKSN